MSPLPNEDQERAQKRSPTEEEVKNAVQDILRYLNLDTIPNGDKAAHRAVRLLDRWSSE